MSVDACVVCVFVCVYFSCVGYKCVCSRICVHVHAHGDRLVETWGFFLGGSTLLLSRDLTQVQIVQLDSHSGNSLCVSLALELCMNQHSWPALARG